MALATSRYGLANVARHVIETHFEPSVLEFTGIL